MQCDNEKLPVQVKLIRAFRHFPELYLAWIIIVGLTLKLSQKKLWTPKFAYSCRYFCEDLILNFRILKSTEFFFLYFLRDLNCYQNVQGD